VCGIGGFRRYGNTPITKDNIDTLLIGLEQRGNDATGIAIMRDDGKMWVLKDDEPAWKFVASKEYKELLDEHLEHARTIILHTRFASVGSPREHKNNHPMFKGHIALVHNGGINNHEELFRELKLERSAETDSDILRAILDEEGFTKKAIRTLNRCNGPAAIAAINPAMPEHLLLGRSGSPLVCAKYGDLLVWASEKHYIHKAMRPWADWLKLSFQEQKVEIGFLTMADDTIWLFGPEGIEWHDKFATCNNFTQVAKYRPTYDNYTERNSRWGKGVKVDNAKFNFPELVWCKGCGRKHKFSEASRMAYQLHDYRCSGCKEFLAKKPS
jgi:predicted glutamine amidotransferase